MEHSIFGLVYHSNELDSNQEHSHEIYLVTWDGSTLHVHNFSGITSFDIGHRHHYSGRTEPALSGVPHIHAYFTATSFDDGHTHTIHGRTGPAIKLPGGEHYHYFEGITTANGRIPHRHNYSGRTTVS